MEKTEKLSQFMLKQHGEIISLLYDFKNGFKRKSNKIDEIFEKFKEKLENHIFAEEKAIFIFVKEDGNSELLAKILQQHNEIEKFIKQIEEKKDRDINFQKELKDMENLTKEHISLEDKKFYPMLDKMLSKEQQKEILEKVRGYILGNIGFK